MAGRDEVKSSAADAVEAVLDVGHELAANVLERVDAEGARLARLHGGVALGFVALGEDGKQDVVLRRDAERRRQIGAGLADVGGLHQVVVVLLVAALDGDLGVRVVVLVVVAHANQLGAEHGRRRRRRLHLGGEEVAESFRAEAVNVVDGVALPGERVDKHARAGGDRRLGDHEHAFPVQAATGHGRHLGPVGRVARVGDAHVQHLADRRVGRTGRHERHGRRSRVVGHHCLFYFLLHVRDVVQVAH